MSWAKPSFLRLERQVVFLAASLARAKTGKRIAASIAIIAITTSSSISVKARRVWRIEILLILMSAEFVRLKLFFNLIHVDLHALTLAAAFDSSPCEKADYR